MRAQPAHPTLSPQEFLTVVMRYVEACRAHDARLLLVFALALLAALEAIAVGYWFRGANVFASLAELGAFSRVWIALTVIAGVGLLLYILATSARFHREVVPKCPRCTVSVRNLDDFLMSMSFPALPGATSAIRCDVCNHGIAEFSPGAFRSI
ncbi:MAG: hypothetical protein JNJ55_09970 [Betaproteobacteria bacterium]|nr:hypothetical protein [Betaproteobacteria bacterium]